MNTELLILVGAVGALYYASQSGLPAKGDKSKGGQANGPPTPSTTDSEFGEMDQDPNTRQMLYNPAPVQAVMQDHKRLLVKRNNHWAVESPELFREQMEMVRQPVKRL